MTTYVTQITGQASRLTSGAVTWSPKLRHEANMPGALKAEPQDRFASFQR
jgi:hypothetical protein